MHREIAAHDGAWPATTGLIFNLYDPFDSTFASKPITYELLDP